MIMKYFEYDIPSIYLYHSHGFNDLDRINEILWGMEEEGIPYEVIGQNYESSEELSHIASQQSKLSVGIGIDKYGKITLTHNKLKKEEPLFTASLDDEANSLRSLGANAGRLVKGIAFK